MYLNNFFFDISVNMYCSFIFQCNRHQRRLPPWFLSEHLAGYDQLVPLQEAEFLHDGPLDGVHIIMEPLVGLHLQNAVYKVCIDLYLTQQIVKFPLN